MPEAREWTREELLNKLNDARDYITKLEAENRELKAMAESLDKDLYDARRAAELRFQDGMIEALKFAIKCNGVSGGEVS